MSEMILYLAAFAAVVGVAVAMAIIAVRRNGQGTSELIKQFLIWVSIVALLPLTSYAGATMLHPPKKMKDLMAQQNRVQQETNDTNDVSVRKAVRDRVEAICIDIERERRAFYRAMFWVSFPIGYAALVAGLFLRGVPVGSALAFGGLCTLTAGCYTYWDDMGDTLRFVSLLIALATVIAIGLFKFNRPANRAVAPTS